MEGQTVKRWVIALNDPRSSARMLRELGEDIQVSCARDGLSALELVRQEMPDVLVADLALPCLEAAALFERVQTLPLDTLPWAVALSLPGLEPMENCARRAGACRVLKKPVPGPWLFQTARSLVPMERLPRKGVTLQGIERLLWSLGFSASSQGTRCLALAVEMCCRDMGLTAKLTSVVYPQAAILCGATPQRVEHAIRRAIDAAWSRGPSGLQYRLFGNTIEAKRGKPTAGGMIARTAELLRTGMEIEA